MRFTVVQGESTISFSAPCTFLKALVAAVSAGATDFPTLLANAASYDDYTAPTTLNGLAVFDERNSSENYENITRTIELADNKSLPVFRVVNELTRAASLQPVNAGLVIFNLTSHKIIQVQNSYAEIKRRDRGRIHEGGHPTSRLYYYTLPEEWQILP